MHITLTTTKRNENYQKNKSLRHFNLNFKLLHILVCIKLFPMTKPTSMYILLHMTIYFHLYSSSMIIDKEFSKYYLKQSCCRITLQTFSQFVNLIQQEHWIVNPNCLQAIDYTSRHTANIGAPTESKQQIYKVSGDKSSTTQKSELRGGKKSFGYHSNTAERYYTWYIKELLDSILISFSIKFWL